MESEPSECEKLWASVLESSWRGRTAMPDLDALFSTCDDPFATALRVANLCGSRRDFGPKSVPYVVVDRLKKWASSRGVVLRDKRVKMAALELAVSQKNSSFIRLAADAYELHEERDSISPFVRRSIENGDYNVACHCVVAFGLHADFGRDDLLLPLLLQDKICLIDEYLGSRPDLAPEFVAYLDELVRDGNVAARMRAHLQDNGHVRDVKWEKLHRRSIGKLIARLCKKFDVSMDSCENLSRMRALGGLRFLVRQRYEENSIGEGAWDDLVGDALAGNPDLLGEFVGLVAMYDAREANKWARKFGASTLEPSAADASSGTQRDETTRLRYYDLTIPSDGIVLVDDEIAFERVLRRDLVDVARIGIDSEWKPSFGTKPSSVSLIQVATRSGVFIFDVLALNEKRFSHLWSAFATRIFDNSDVVKIGFGLDNDMREITASVSGLSSVKYGGFGYLELRRLWKIFTDAGVSLPFQKTDTGEGLSSIVEQCFGLRLNKDEQCSNWENRPLRQSQIKYASIDAHVLVEIYELISDLCSKCDLDFEEICLRVMEKSEYSKTKKKRVKDKVNPDNKITKPNL